MIRIKLWIGIFLLFSLGAISGSLLSGIYYKSEMERVKKYGTSGRVPLVMPELIKELNLSNKQTREIRKVIMQFNEKRFDIQKHAQQEMNTLRENLLTATKEKLGDVQKQKYDDLFEKLTLTTPMLPKIMETGFETQREIMSRLKHRFKLTTQQQSEIRLLITESIHKKEEIHQELREAHFQDRQRQLENRRHHFQDHKSAEEKMQKLIKELEVRMENILTPEQMGVYRSAKEDTN